MQMYPCRYVVMQMSSWCMPWCECPIVICNDVNAPLWVCNDANVLLWVYHDTNALMQSQFIQKFPLFSKQGFFSAWNPNIFKTQFILPKKSSSFLLKAPKKNWWLLLEIFEWGHWLGNLMTWLKRFIFTIWLSKRMACFQGLFFWKNEFFENQAS